MQDGYDTDVGEKSALLSGGQKQVQYSTVRPTVKTVYIILYRIYHIVTHLLVPSRTISQCTISNIGNDFVLLYCDRLSVSRAIFCYFKRTSCDLTHAYRLHMLARRCSGYRKSFSLPVRPTDFEFFVLTRACIVSESPSPVPSSRTLPSSCWTRLRRPLTTRARKW